MAERHRLALSLPGIGPATARIVVAELPEDLGARTTAQICSYAGVAPLDDQSGRRRGRASIGRGNVRLKAALYMPAMVCVRTQPWARDLKARLMAKGKTHRQAIVAVMRRLLVRLVAVLKRGSAWEPEPRNT